MQLIAVNGFKRSGKGTVAGFIEELSPEKHVVGVGFADKLKVLASRSLGYTELSDQECIEKMDDFKEDGWVSSGHELPTYDITGRQYLQNIGNEARQIFGDSFWIDQVLPNPAFIEGWGDANGEALERRYPGVDILVITDLRYPNEAERVKSLGGVVWEVVRPGLESDGHASEQPLPRHLVDATIKNDRGLIDLMWETEKVLETL